MDVSVTTSTVRQRVEALADALDARVRRAAEQPRPGPLPARVRSAAAASWSPRHPAGPRLVGV